MSTLPLIKEAILALKERTGSSISAINKYLLTEKRVRHLLRKFY
jgi:linker histone H1 and H5 family